MNRMHYQRQLIELETEHKEYIDMLKIEVKGTDRRTKIQIEAKLNEEAEAQIKLDVRRVETLTARGAKGWLQQSVRRKCWYWLTLQRLIDCLFVFFLLVAISIDKKFHTNAKSH